MCDAIKRVAVSEVQVDDVTTMNSAMYAFVIFCYKRKSFYLLCAKVKSR